jgi:DNA repair protein SbcC/Rad50
MLELVSVEVTNFRSFSAATFAPLGIGQGMTAINGSNGMGKSSIVHAIVWALYGVTPDGVRVGALRKQGSDGDVEAKVTLRHDNQTVVVTRGLRGRNDTTIASISVDGIEQTNVSAKTATSWIISRLGLDSEAFLVAFVVRQKELDSLVRARPADRRKTIERLAGIERMSAALEKARAAARAAARLLEALPPTVDPEVAQKHLQACQDAHAQAIQDLAAATGAADLARQASQTATSAVTAARESLQLATRADHALELAQQALTAAEATVQRLTNAATGAQDLPSAQAEARNTQSALSEADARVREVKAIVARAQQDADRAEQADRDVTRAEQVHSDAQAALGVCNAAVAGIPDTLSSDARAAHAKVRELADKRGAARGEWERLNKAIDALKAAASHDAAACPTCDHPLLDATVLIERLERDLAKIKTQGADLADQLSDAQATAEDLDRQQSAAQAANAAHLTASANLDNANEALGRARTAAMRATDAAETSAEHAHEARLAAATAEQALPALRQAYDNAQHALRQSETAAQAAGELGAAHDALAAAQVTRDNALAAVAKFRAATADVNLTALQEASLQAATADQAAHDTAQQCRTNEALTLRDVNTAQDAVTAAISQAQSRRDALSDVERTSAVASALDEFRRDRLARLTPELSEVASDFISRMTDGKYTSVILDEDFTPVLTDASGIERPSAWLSGGEESAVALALRVAIGEVLDGPREGLPVPYEVLTAQDQSRRQATMAAIRTLPRQVITINHVSEATDMVDLVAEVISDGENGSTIIDIAPDGLLGANVSDELIDA